MADELSLAFGALADPTRRDMLERLAEGDATVTSLAERYDLTLQAVSKHVKVLQAAGLVTKDLNRAHRVIHQLEAGICWINAWGESDAKMPVGGYKQSGIGRENGISSLAQYTQIKSVQVELGDYVSVF